MSNICKFQKKQKFVSYDNGATWQPLQVYEKGDLIEYASPDCGSTGEEYRWVLVDNGYICEGKNKYTKYIYQVSYDGINWYNVTPTQYKKGELVESNSSFCDNASEGHYDTDVGGYDPIWVIKCEESGTVLTATDIQKANQCLTRITLSNCVVGIDEGAFSGQCLTEITIPDSVSFIGASGFSRCQNMEYIYLNDSLEQIGERTFFNCNRLKSIYIPSSLSSIPTRAFESCDSLNNIIIPSNVQSVGEYAFYGCDSLSDVTINEGVESIGDGAFDTCKSLTRIVFPSTITNIGDLVNAGGNVIKNWECTLKSLTPPTIQPYVATTLPWGTNGTFSDASIINVPCQAFGAYYENEDYSHWKNILRPYGECSDSARWVISGNICVGGKLYSQQVLEYKKNDEWIKTDIHQISSSSIGTCSSKATIYTVENDTITIECNDSKILKNSEISSYNIKGVEIGDCTESLGNGVFCDSNGKYNSITSVTMSNSLVTIGNSAFTNCHNITAIAIPNSVTTLGENAFSSCWSITSLTISNNITSIPKDAFVGCINLTNVDIPQSVISIGNSAFEYCSGMTSINFKEGIASIGASAFYDTPLMEVVLPSTISFLGHRCFDDVTSSVKILATTPPSLSGNPFSYNDRPVIFVPSNSVDAYKAAFTDFSDDIYAIGAEVPIKFKCKFNDNTYYIKYETIGGNSHIGEIYSAHTTANIKQSNIVGIEIGSATTTIGDYTFQNGNSFGGNYNNVKYVTIPSSVTKIGISAFAGCTSLEKVTIYSIVPPNIKDFVFGKSTCPIYVPAESVETYRTAYKWSSMASRIQPIPNS